MNYKVEFTQTRRYIFDAKADNEDQARQIAQQEFDKAWTYNSIHYFETNDPETDVMVYDVTDTDDAPQDDLTPVC